jgi:hypothetical protein
MGSREGYSRLGRDGRRRRKATAAQRGDGSAGIIAILEEARRHLIEFRFRQNEMQNYQFPAVILERTRKPGSGK